MVSDATVTMNGCGMRPRTNTSPLTSPTARPVPSTTRTTKAVDCTPWKATAPRTPDNASVEPTDKSMPRADDHEKLPYPEYGVDGGL